MLQDVLDLRAANWVPRKVAQVDGPRTIRQVSYYSVDNLIIILLIPSFMLNKDIIFKTLIISYTF